MLRKKTFLIVAVALSAILLAGFVSVSFTVDQPAAYSPNDRANHHPKRLDG